MLSKPCVGWSSLKIKDFESRISYLTDVPIDLLNSIYNFYTNNYPVAVNFDAEGWEFIMVINRFETHIILNGYEYKYFTFDIYFEDLFKEIIEDIEKDFEEWSEWDCLCGLDEDFTENYKENLKDKLKICKKLLTDNKFNDII